MSAQKEVEAANQRVTATLDLTSRKDNDRLKSSVVLNTKSFEHGQSSKFSDALEEEIVMGSERQRGW